MHIFVQEIAYKHFQIKVMIEIKFASKCIPNFQTCMQKSTPDGLNVFFISIILFIMLYIICFHNIIIWISK